MASILYELPRRVHAKNQDEVLPSGKLWVSRVVRGAAGMRFTGLFRFATMPELRSQKP